MTVNEIMAVAAHLHVILRRKTGRVTDIEWMVTSPEYAQAIVNFAKHKSRELNDTDLELWALKLELANQQRPPQGHKPLVQVAIESVQANQAAVQSAPATMPGHAVASPPAQEAPAAPRYIGGIR